MEWTDNLLTGVEVVDCQHIEIITRVNKLLVCAKDEKISEIEGMLDFLADYVTVHFSCEETLQKEVTYPLFEAHKREHDNFIKKFINIRKKYQQELESSVVTNEICVMTFNWLATHIAGSDCEFAKFYRRVKN